jgi:hypothetical protein
VVSLCNISFSLLRHAKSLHSPCWPNLMAGGYRTVPAVHDFLALAQ